MSQREIIPRMGCTDLVQCCPGLETIQLSKTVSCPFFNPSAVIVVGSRDWSECILDSSLETCGNGLQYRRVYCANSMTYTPVDASFCALANKVLPEVSRSCSIRCQRNCEQSHWTQWSPCSTTCGSGLRIRTRVIEVQPEPEGRPCGPEMEMDVCFNVPCPLVEVVLSSYGACVPENATSKCGVGMRVREPLCFVNRVLQELSVCVSLGAVQEFEVVESCSLDCPGECVVGDWGEWSECPTGCPPGSCMQHRQRSVLRRESSGGCSKSVLEQRVCFPVPETYEYRTGPWLNCILTPPTTQEEDLLTLNHYCGVGVHSCSITCFNTTGSTDDLVADIFCEVAGVTRPAGTESCELPCPVDCKVSIFSDWSECALCQPNALQRRSRSILIPPSFGGGECPALEETRPCVPSGCEISDSTVIESFDGVDFTQESQCGFVLQLQPLSCRRNTEFLLPSECPQGESYSSLACPTDQNYTYGEWSDWSDCMSLCHTPGVEFSFRTRPALSLRCMLSATCAREQLQQQECSNPVMPSQNETEVATTPTPCGLDFIWETGEWIQNEREVYCLSNSGVRVENQACPSAIRPRSQNETCSLCPERGVCRSVDGECVLTCQLGTEVVQGACLPTVQGKCFNDGHCLYPNHVCDVEREVCECDQGFISMDNGCFPPTMSTTRPTVAMETTSTEASPTVAMETTSTEASSPANSNTAELTSTDAEGIAQDVSIQMWLIILLAAIISILVIVVVALSVGLCLRSNKICKRKVTEANSQVQLGSLVDSERANKAQPDTDHDYETIQVQLRSPMYLEGANEALPDADHDYETIDDVMTTSASLRCADIAVPDTVPITNQILAHVAFESQLETDMNTGTTSPTSMNNSMRKGIDARPNQARAVFESGELNSVADIEDAETCASHEVLKQTETSHVTCVHNPAYALLGEPSNYQALELL